MKIRIVMMLGITLAVACSPDIETTSVAGTGGATSGTANATSGTVYAATSNTGTFATGTAFATTGGSAIAIATSTVTTTGGVGGAGGSCASYEDAKSNAQTTIRFVNQTPLPIYLPSTCGSVAYTIDPINGDTTTDYPFDPNCLETCQILETEAQPPVCGPCPAITHKIPPNGTLDVTWNGLGLRNGIMMPASCYAPGGKPHDTCSQIVEAPAGEYRVNATGYSSCGSNCTCDTAGNCAGGATGMQAFPDNTKFVYPSNSMVQVVFSSCAFGCP